MAHIRHATVLVVVASGVVGLILGSFFNVVIYRLPKKMSLSTPASHCPGCGHPIGPLDNIPLLSWLVLRGRCRHCQMAISVRYPLVELGTGLWFAGLALANGVHWSLIPLLVTGAAALVAGAIDLDHEFIPRSLMVAALGGPIGLTIVSLLTSDLSRIAWGAGGAATVGLLAIALFGKSETKTGILGSLAWCAGWWWWPGGFAVAGWIALVMIATRRVSVPEPTSSDKRRVPLAFVMCALGAGGLLLSAAAVGSR
jgi:leader peptidase (prepilin peptidase)/N-methyltransferase